MHDTTALKSRNKMLTVSNHHCLIVLAEDTEMFLWQPLITRQLQLIFHKKRFQNCIFLKLPDTRKCFKIWKLCFRINLEFLFFITKSETNLGVKKIPEPGPSTNTVTQWYNSTTTIQNDYGPLPADYTPIFDYPLDHDIETILRALR